MMLLIGIRLEDGNGLVRSVRIPRIPRWGLFNKDAKTIARELASKRVSPKGPSSGMRMLTFISIVRGRICRRNG